MPFTSQGVPMSLLSAKVNESPIRMSTDKLLKTSLGDRKLGNLQDVTK